MEGEWPQLIDGWDDDHPPDLAICEQCGNELRFNPEEGCPSMVPMLCTVCGGLLIEKYDLGVRCDNCGALDYDHPYHGTMVRRVDCVPTRSVHACSRACWLQVEYADSLKEQLAAA